MSSILEALERAEKERNQIEKRSFIDPGLATSGLLQRRWIWVLAGILLINLLIWLWLLMRSGESADDERRPVAAQAVKQQLATADTVVSILEQPTAGVERKSDPPLVVEALVAKKNGDTIAPAPAARMPVAARPALPAPQPQVEMVQTAVPVQPVEATTKPLGVQAELPKAAEPVVVATVVPAETATSATSVGLPVPPEDNGHEQAAEEDKTNQIPSLWELPANLQEKLSDLKINIHVYNAEASQRFVIINMHKYREGDRLEPSGMRLERITREGIVINHGAGLVRM